MDISDKFNGREQAITDLFTKTFTDSEGAEEGELIGGLVRDLIGRTAPDDIHIFTGEENGKLIAGAVFTRLTYENDHRTVFILSPMAVTTERQGEGIGQDLLRRALVELRKSGVDIAMTYGDPAFYGKVGFIPISENIAPPPLPLSQPEGWIGQSLTGETFTPLLGPSNCVAALNNTAFW